MSEENGNEPQVLTLTLVRNPWQLTIGGQVDNLNLALAMVSEALRTIETEWKLAAAVEAQNQHKVTQRVRGILDRSAIRQ